MPPPVCSRLDPPANFFRIRLVCTLLEACAQYFSRGPARRKLERFVPYLQRYVLAKPPLPRFPEDGVLRGSLFAIHGLGIRGIEEPRFAG